MCMRAGNVHEGRETFLPREHEGRETFLPHEHEGRETFLPHEHEGREICHEGRKIKGRQGTWVCHLENC